MGEVSCPDIPKEAKTGTLILDSNHLLWKVQIVNTYNDSIDKEWAYSYKLHWPARYMPDMYYYMVVNDNPACMFKFLDLHYQVGVVLENADGRKYECAEWRDSLVGKEDAPKWLMLPTIAARRYDMCSTKSFIIKDRQPAIDNPIKSDR